MVEDIIATDASARFLIKSLKLLLGEASSHLLFVFSGCPQKGISALPYPQPNDIGMFFVLHLMACVWHWCSDPEGYNWVWNYLGDDKDGNDYSSENCKSRQCVFEFSNAFIC